MSEWKESIDLSDLWASYDDGNIKLNDLVTQVSARFRTTRLCRHDERAREVIENLSYASKREGFDIDDFDNHLDKIYDLADVNQRLWIRTH